MPELLRTILVCSVLSAGVLVGGALAGEALGSMLPLLALLAVVPWLSERLRRPGAAEGNAPGWVAWADLLVAAAIGAGWTVAAREVAGADVPQVVGADGDSLVVIAGLFVNLPLAEQLVRLVMGRWIARATASARVELAERLAEATRPAHTSERPVPMTYREDGDGVVFATAFTVLFFAVTAVAIFTSDGSTVDKVVLGGGIVALIAGFGWTLLRAGLRSSFSVGPSGLIVDGAPPVPWSAIEQVTVDGSRCILTATEDRELVIDADDFDLSVPRVMEILSAWTALELRIA